MKQPDCGAGAAQVTHFSRSSAYAAGNAASPFHRGRRERCGRFRAHAIASLHGRSRDSRNMSRPLLTWLAASSKCRDCYHHRDAGDGAKASVTTADGG